jgi:hypothetical protein
MRDPDLDFDPSRFVEFETIEVCSGLCVYIYTIYIIYICIYIHVQVQDLLSLRPSRCVLDYVFIYIIYIYMYKFKICDIRKCPDTI